MRGAVAPALRYVVRVPDDRRRALSDGGPRRRELPARGVPQPQPRRPLLLLGIRSQTQHTGRTRRIPAVRLAGPGRPGDDTSVRADLRARRPHPVLSRYAGLGGAGGHPAHHQHLSGLFLGSAVGDRKGFRRKRRLLLTPGSGDDAARHGRRRRRTGRRRTGIPSATTSRRISSTSSLSLEPLPQGDIRREA